MQCPTCGSGDLKRLSVVIEEGTFTGTSETEGSVTGTTRGAAGGQHLYASTSESVSTRTATTSSSVLAQKLAPPEKESITPRVVVALVAGFVGALAVTMGLGLYGTTGDVVGFSVMAVIVALFVPSIMRKKAFNEQEWPELYERWEHSFHCSRCGEIFEQRFET